MLPPTLIVCLGFATLLPTVLAYPQDARTPVVQADSKPKFIIGAIGDSWASGVTYPAIPPNNYDDNKDGCMRYKYAWSTVINENYATWAPDAGAESQFEFTACSGAHLENIKDQMDKLTRPKLVLMEAGGNNADFYPLADSCLFHQDLNKNYGPSYENETDTTQEPKGECRREIGKVRDRLTGGNMELTIVNSRDPTNPDISMEWKARNQESKVGLSNGGGLIARRLHPTQDGHRAMGDIVVKRLEQIYKNIKG